MLRFGTVAAASLMWLSQLCPAQIFMGLGFFPGDTSSKAVSLSADGQTVVGDGLVGQGVDAWRWHPGGLVQSIGSQLFVTSVSADGSAMAGGRVLSSINHPVFRWTTAGGVQAISDLQAGLSPSPGISGDGLVVAGGGGARWTQATGVVALPNPPSGPYGTATGLASASAANNDGSVIVGGVYIQAPGSSFVSAYSWTAAGGSQVLTLPGGGLAQGAATSVSLDGGTVLACTDQVYRWQAATGLLPLSGLSVNFSIAPPSLSGDGNTVVSLGNVWNVSTGTQPLTTLLTSSGCNFSGWTNLIVTGVDGDGQAFCGYGTDPAGATEAWYATVPAPGAAPFLVGLLALRRRRA